MNKEEAKIRLQSKPLAAALWLNASDEIESSAGHLPDPAFAASQHWPDYGKPKIQEKVLENVPPQKPGVEFIKSSVENLNPEPETTTPVKIPVDEKVKIEIASTEYTPAITDEPSHTEMKHSKKIARITRKANQTDEAKPGKKVKKKKEAGAQVEDFYSWLKTMPTDSGQTKIKTEKSKKKDKSSDKPKSETKMNQAEKSLKLGEEIVSETLARLLARQGYKDDAIEMYEKLRKKYPQKDSTFAAAIEKLKS